MRMKEGLQILWYSSACMSALRKKQSMQIKEWLQICSKKKVSKNALIERENIYDNESNGCSFNVSELGGKYRYKWKNDFNSILNISILYNVFLGKTKIFQLCFEMPGNFEESLSIPMGSPRNPHT